VWSPLSSRRTTVRSKTFWSGKERSSSPAPSSKDGAFSCLGFGEVGDLWELKGGKSRPSDLMTLSILQPAVPFGNHSLLGGRGSEDTSASSRSRGLTTTQSARRVPPVDPFRFSFFFFVTRVLAYGLSGYRTFALFPHAGGLIRVIRPESGEEHRSSICRTLPGLDL